VSNSTSRRRSSSDGKGHLPVDEVVEAARTLAALALDQCGVG
jgi:hypothetical protein